MGGGGREVAPLAVLEGRLAGARGLEEAGHVHGGRLPPDLAEGLALPAHLWRPGVGPLRGQHLGVRVVRLLQPLRPRGHHPAVVFHRGLGLQDHLPAAEHEGALGAQYLEPAFRRGLVVESRAEVHREALGVLEDRVHRVRHFVGLLVAVVLAHGHHPRGHLGVHQEVDGGQQVDEEVGGDTPRVVPVAAPAEEALEAEGLLGSRAQEGRSTRSCACRSMRRAGKWRRPDDRQAARFPLTTSLGGD